MDSKLSQIIGQEPLAIYTLKQCYVLCVTHLGTFEIIYSTTFGQESPIQNCEGVVDGQISDIF